MNLKNSRNWSAVPRPRAYGIAMVITLSAFALRKVLHPYVEPYAPFQMFVVASLLTEYLFGLGPALLSAAIGLALGTHYFIAPYGVSDGISRSDVIVTFNYAFVTLFAVVLVDYLQRTLYSNQLWLKIAESRHLISLLRENDRLHLSKKAASALRPVEKLLADLPCVLALQVGDATYPQPLCYRLCASAAIAVKHSEWMQLFHPDDRAVVQTGLARMADGAASGPAVCVRIRGRDGYQGAELSFERITVGGTVVVAVILPACESLLAAGPADAVARGPGSGDGDRTYG